MNTDDMKRIWGSMTLAERASDLELSQVRLERENYLSELDREGCSMEEQHEAWSEVLEEKLARLYCKHYEREL